MTIDTNTMISITEDTRVLCSISPVQAGLLLERHLGLV